MNAAAKVAMGIKAQVRANLIIANRFMVPPNGLSPIELCFCHCAPNDSGDISNDEKH